MPLDEKLNTLIHRLEDLGSVVVAYSGGVDSTLLLKVAHYTLGERAVALTAVSASLPADELEEAQQMAREIGARHVLIDSHETEDPRYLSNSPQRCYFCKSDVFQRLIDYAKENGFSWVVDGTNSDDAHDHRPGRQAARELGVLSPLQEANLTKSELRTLARRFGLPNWDKPAAACLSSRIPYGQLITLERLSQVEQAERVLHRLGFRQVRVRHHDMVARIEILPDEFSALFKQRDRILKELNNLGFPYVTLDLAGFRSGSMNEALAIHGQRKNTPDPA